jgi:hypothetical protein
VSSLKITIAFINSDSALYVPLKPDTANTETIPMINIKMDIILIISRLFFVNMIHPPYSVTFFQIVLFETFEIVSINPLYPPILGDFLKLGGTPRPPPEGNPSGLP